MDADKFDKSTEPSKPPQGDAAGLEADSPPLSGSLSKLPQIAGMEQKRKWCERERQLPKMAAAVTTLLECLGEDVKRDGLLDTPMRMAKALQFFTSGYELDLKEVIGGAVFDEPTAEGMVVLRDVDIFSLCEHHMIPFFGKAHIAYIPQGKVLGLSKLARVVEVFARRLQVQERMTQQIAQAINDSINARGVGVVLECTHMCVSMRGVQKPGAVTTTSCMLGEFRENSKTRAEFLGFVRKL